MPEDRQTSHDAAYNRDRDQKAGAARPATEPHGAEGSATSSKTLTDPASGAGQKTRHAPNRAEADQVDGASRPGR